ncbi:MAG TPA: hypothetical protein VGO58_04330 [Chitinophagaceae bacterium]|nr:hypothetical protein [Chitinophagaceae bacterium]
MKKIFITCLFAAASTITICQNVGVGTSNPTEKLEVAGNVKANGIKIVPNAGSGKVLTSDANGNGSWQQVTASGGGDGASSWGDCTMNGVGGYQAVGDTAGAEDDHLGYKVAISGDFAIASAPFDDIGANVDQGSVSFFHFTGSSWELLQKITEAAGSAGDFFGAGIAINGNYAIIGTPGDDLGVNINQGSASIYHYNGSSWVFLQKLNDPNGQQEDLFGISVSIDGNFAVAGANGDDIGPNNEQGSACIFRNTGGVWGFMQKINDAFGAIDDAYGTSVTVAGNNIIVGSPGDDITTQIDQGSALFYFFNGSSWVLRIKLTDANGGTNDNFGHSVSVSGNYAAIGSPVSDWIKVDQGVVNLYRLNGVNWEFFQRLASDEPDVTDGFGFSVTLSGNYLVVGIPYDNVGPVDNKGSATIFEKVGIGWAKVQYLHDKMGRPDDDFGYNVAIDGNTKRFLAGVFGYGKESGKIVFGKVY